MKELPATYDIFMDGSCSFCRWTQMKVKPYDSNSRLRFLDYNDPEVAARAGFPRAELDSEMHLLTPGGKWLRGFDAWLAILKVLPKFAWLGRVAALPPLHWLGPPLYAFIAKHRYRLPGAPARCESDTCALPARRKG
jgi:predicted DCC family thiol-disulfide oxidoreductase YuxK